MKIKCDLTLGDKFVEVVGIEGGECEVRVGGSLNLNELTAVHVIAEAMRCLKNNRAIDLHFNPLDRNETDSNQLVKLEWLDSGILVYRCMTDKKYQHAETIGQAMLRKRTFTCTAYLRNVIPARRYVAK